MTVFESYQLTEFNSLFEIPIYRINPKSFEIELQKNLDEICKPLSDFEVLFPNNAIEKHDSHRRSLELHFAYPWKFNEIIGWVLLNIDREIFSGELFYTKGKKIRRNSKNKIYYYGEAFRFDCLSDMTNLEIFNRILMELRGVAKKGITKGRYVDAHRFETVGKYIDWADLFKDLRS